MKNKIRRLKRRHMYELLNKHFYDVVLFSEKIDGEDMVNSLSNYISERSSEILDWAGYEKEVAEDSWENFIINEK